MDSIQDFELDRIVLRHAEATGAIDRIQDAVVREAVRFSLYRAMTRFMRWEGQSDEAFLRQLPAAAFDAMFFVEIAIDIFSHRDRVERLLRGEVVDDFEGGDLP